jgi:hypothetical protein
MNRPRFTTMALGHPLVAWPVLGFGLFMIYATIRNPAIWLWGLFALWGLYRVADASLRRLDYLDWKRDWMGMGGSGRQRQPSSPRPWKQWIGWAATVGTIGALLADADDPQARTGLFYLVVCLAGAGLAKWWGRHHKAKAAKAAIRTQPVTVCVKGPLLRVPRLRNAYRAVPDYCKPLLQAAR